jgi:PAS domain S-box-containing protein
MKLPNPHIQTSEDYRSNSDLWISLILLSSALAIAGNISVLITGINFPADLLFFVPIVIAAAKYSWYGTFFSVVLAVLYLAPFPFFPHEFEVWIAALLRAGSLIGIASITTYLAQKNIRIKTELFNNKRQFKRIADYTYNWEYWLDHENKLLYMSPAVNRITGYSPDQFKKDPDLFNKIIHPLDKAAWQNHKFFAHLNDSSRRPVETEFRIVTAKGETRWIGHVSRRLYDEYKRYQGLRVSNRDITAQVEAEEKLLEISMESEKKERNFYSREIHDRLGPLLSTIKLYFQWLAETNDIEKSRIITEKGNQSIDIAIETLREISHNMSSYNLDRLGFIKALENIADQIDSTQKISITVTTNSYERFEKTKEVALYYVVSELINNTIKHANAQNISIDCLFSEQTRTMTIHYEDDGSGFDMNAQEDNATLVKGLGLLNIQQRIKALRGKFTISTSPEKGFKAVVELPV